MFFSICVFSVVFGLLVFCLTESKGTNTPHARRSRIGSISVPSSKEAEKQMSVSDELVETSQR